MELAELGYDSKRRFKPQVNLLYVYSLSSDVSAPVYYKQFLGSTPDVSAFADILNECGISSKKYTVIADKGFAAEEQFEALTEKELSYVIPIKRGSKLVAAYLPLTPQSFSDLLPITDEPFSHSKSKKTASMSSSTTMRSFMPMNWQMLQNVQNRKTR